MAFMFLSHELPLLLFQLLISFLRTSGVWSQHQIQPLAQIPGSLMSRCNAQILVGHLLVQPVLLYFFYDLFALRGISSLSAPLPSYAVCFGQLAVSAMLCDTLNYWSHRTLHHSLFYARFHKQHHEFHSVVPLFVALSLPLFPIFFFFPDHSLYFIFQSIRILFTIGGNLHWLRADLHWPVSDGHAPDPGLHLRGVAGVRVCRRTLRLCIPVVHLAARSSR